MSMEVKVQLRPVLRIDTSGCSAPRSWQKPQPHPDSPSSLLSSNGPHDFSREQDRPPGLKEPWQQCSTSGPECSKARNDLESPEEPFTSRKPLNVFNEYDTFEGKISLNVYGTEIRITEVETKDGYNSIKTIIRPASSSLSSTAAISRPLKASISPIASFFSRPPTPISTLQPSSTGRAMPHPGLPSPLRTASWRLPHLGLHGRKHVRGRSSYSFEEEVDYLQAKLEKEALGGASAIRIEMEVEQSIHIEKGVRPRHRRVQRTQK